MVSRNLKIKIIHKLENSLVGRTFGTFGSDLTEVRVSKIEKCIYHYIVITFLVIVILYEIFISVICFYFIELGIL